MSAEILIIDDNSDIREILNDLIIEAGYSTRLAANYNQALAEIDKKLPDVAIIDVKLDNRKTKNLDKAGKVTKIVEKDNTNIDLVSEIKAKNSINNLNTKINSNENNKVMVHCVDGKSRSAAVIIAYVMKSKQMKLIEAFKYVRNSKMDISPSKWFWNELKVFENTLHT